MVRDQGSEISGQGQGSEFQRTDCVGGFSSIRRTIGDDELSPGMPDVLDEWARGTLESDKKNICGIWVQISLRQGLGGGHALQIILNIEVIHRLFLAKDLWGNS